MRGWRSQITQHFQEAEGEFPCAAEQGISFWQTGNCGFRSRE
jgi:hypothetical protein